jgi:6,7-dimethyl-8-ribityllumazine synthase
MSKALPSPPGIEKTRRTFHIVASRFNTRYVDGLLDHVTKELHALAPDSTVLVHRVPGSFEIPVLAREVAIQDNTDAIIACGVILKGETDHAQNLSRSVTDALQCVAIENGVPVINAVLSFDNEDQARARCLENKINRGTEAARAAVEIANVLADVRSKQGAADSKTAEG